MSLKGARAQDRGHVLLGTRARLPPCDNAGHRSDQEQLACDRFGYGGALLICQVAH